MLSDHLEGRVTRLSKHSKALRIKLKDERTKKKEEYTAEGGRMKKKKRMNLIKEAGKTSIRKKATKKDRKTAVKK